MEDLYQNSKTLEKTPISADTSAKNDVDTTVLLVSIIAVAVMMAAVVGYSNMSVTHPMLNSATSAFFSIFLFN